MFLVVYETKIFISKFHSFVTIGKYPTVTTCQHIAYLRTSNKYIFSEPIVHVFRLKILLLKKCVSSLHRICLEKLWFSVQLSTGHWQKIIFLPLSPGINVYTGLYKVNILSFFSILQILKKRKALSVLESLNELLLNATKYVNTFTSACSLIFHKFYSDINLLLFSVCSI